jgi:hypothetical protein
MHNGVRMTLEPPLTSVNGTSRLAAHTRWIVLAISIMAGLVATIDGPRPTDTPVTDTMLVLLAVGGITWLGAAALRRDTACITLIAAVTSLSVVGTAIGVVAAAAGVGLPTIPERRGILNATLVGIAMNIAARSQLGGFLGASTLVAAALGTYISVVGFRCRAGRSRWVVPIIGAAATATAVVAVLAFGIFGYLATNDLRSGNASTTAGLAALGSGDVAAAKASFDAAATSFAASDSRLTNPLVAAAQFVPGIAQHHRVATELISEAADTARFLSSELDAVDLDRLRVAGSRIDIEQVTALQTPLLAIQQRIASLHTTVEALDSPWLVAPVDNLLNDLSADLAKQYRRSEDALTVAFAAPGLLGADGPRTYFVGFTTPAEARGTGGFMGNWAEMTVTDGQIEMTRFGRADDLNLAGDPTLRRFSTSDDADLTEWTTRYGAFSLTSGPDGTTGADPWKSINMSPDVAATGRAIADLYPQSGGRRLDGLLLLDVYALARLLEFTGPIPLPQDDLAGIGPDVLTADTAAAFLLKDQYDLTQVDARVDVLEIFSRTVIDTLLAGTLPSPTALIDSLGPMAHQGRFAAWMSRPDEQVVLEQIGLSGTLPAPGTGDGVAVVFNNAVGNKIDFYLRAAATYEVTADARTGTTAARLGVTITNDSPVDGEPTYVIGNPIGLPTGTNRTQVSIFTRLPVQEVRLDGRLVTAEPGTEADYFVTTVYVVLPAGTAATLDLDLMGPLDVADGYTLVTRTPPTVVSTPLVIDATWIDPDGQQHLATAALNDPGSITLRLDAASAD